MFLNEKDYVFLFFFVAVLILVFVYLLICDYVVRRVVFNFFCKYKNML